MKVFSKSARRRGLLLVCLAVTGCARQISASEPAALRVEADVVSVQRDSPVQFTVAAVETGPALPLSPVTGRVTSVEALTSPAFAPLPGRVVEAKVRLGDHVQRGQKLLQIRSAELPTLEHSVRSAELAVVTYTASAARMRALVESRAGSVHDLALAESQLAEAKLALKAARSRLSSLQVKRADDTAFWMLAARSGTVVQLDATPGLQVGPERGPLITIAELSQVLVVGDVPQRDAADLLPGAEVEIHAAGVGAAALPGTVEAVSEIVDPERQTVPVRVRVDNSQRRLRPNAFVDLGFRAAGARDVVLVPAAALVRDGASAVVFVERRAGEYERRTVVAGRRSRDQVEIYAGLRAGEKVVTSGALLLLNALDVQA